MDIREAVKKVMEKEGVGIISSPDFIKLLTRRRVFAAHPEYKQIIKSIQSLRFDEGLLLLEPADKDIGIYFLRDLFADKTSYKQSDIKDVFEAIGYGLNLISNVQINNEKPKFVKETNSNDSSSTDIFESKIYEEQSYSGDSLPSILRDVIKNEGLSIILEPRFINMLNDLGAFKSSTVHRFILKTIQSEGFGKSLLSVKKWELQGESLCQKFISQTGFQQKEAREAFLCLAYGLGYIDSIPAITIDNSTDFNNSQNHQSHLAIKSIPINGNITDFINKLLAKGATILTEVSPEYTFASVVFTFMRQKGCILYAFCTYISRTVYNASVKFPDAESWREIVYTYNECKETLIKKYGDPVDCSESFEIDCADDNERFDAAKEDKIEYFSYFETNEGSIHLYVLGVNVHLDYDDAINSKLRSEEDKQVAYEDL